MKNNTADGNTAIGFQTLVNNTRGTNNTATGLRALFRNTSGDFNTANGYQALYSNTVGVSNTAIGFQTLSNNTTGSVNTAIGIGALLSNTSGSGNIAIGEDTLNINTSGNDNIAVGSSAGVDVRTASNVICIGPFVSGGNESNTTHIGNFLVTATFISGINGTTIPGPAVTVLINGDQLGTAMSSSNRFKQDIQPMDKASEALFSLKPVTFRYKKEIDPTGRSQFGLVAEEVAKVNPDLIVRDKEGKPSGVYYEAVNAMLLNEFLKEHKAFVVEQHNV